MSIKTPIITEIAYRTWCINEFGMSAMFLLEGDEKALLLDTGSGACDLPGLIAHLTDRPLVVALTHGHVDHVGGMNLFNTVYLHPDDFGRARGVTVEERRDYVQYTQTFAGGIFDVSADSVVVSDRKAQLQPLQEGETIHLGGRDIEVYETPGHTPGGLSFLDKGERILFSGDACNMNTLLAMNAPGEAKTQVSSLLYTARKLDSLGAYYDRHYNGHIGYGEWVDALPMAEGLVKDCVGLCEGLLDGSVKGVADSSNRFTGPCLLARCATMQVLYREDQLR